jgi:hypothetical protein
MGMHATKTTKACSMAARGRQLGDEYGAVITHYDTFDFSTTVD